VIWLSFLLGIAVSLAANIAAAPTLAWQSILVAGWPPVALLLAAELLTHYHGPRDQTEIQLPAATPVPDVETDRSVATRAVSRPGQSPAEQIMWEHYLREQTRGRTPSGAELDRVAGTNNYGRTVLRRWRQQERIPPDPDRRRVSSSTPVTAAPAAGPMVTTAWICVSGCRKWLSTCLSACVVS
jgi:hypothetical protein